MINKLNQIYNMFSDNLSKELYRLRVNWLMTGDYKYIKQIVEYSHPEEPVWNGKEEKEFLNILPQNKKIIFYGAGSFAERLIPYLKTTSLKCEFCDTNKKLQETGFEGYNVISPQALIGMKENKAVIICTTKYIEEVKKYLLENGIKKEDIIDIRPYFKCGTGDEYFNENFLKYSEKEIFIDAGSFDLGTVIDFKKVCNTLTKAYAFEPDASNYKKCLHRLEEQKSELPQTKLYQYGTWSCTTELCFDSTSDGCSHIGEGKTIIKTAAIDDLVDKGDKITFIKMDVEGAELESLKGAKKIIQRDKPKLAICIYHKPEDVITLPLYIKQLVPEYKFYLRSYSNADNEMVLYAVL
jgi:FkbM family methyltransferase